MGDRYTEGGVRGFLVQDIRIDLDHRDAAESTYTEASPRPASIVAADTRSKALPAISGGQSNDLDLVVLRGGNPEPTIGAGIGYRLGSGGAATVRSWNPLNVAQHTQVVEYESSSGIDHQYRTMAVNPDTQVVVCAHADEVSAPSATVLQSHWLDPATRVWTSVSIVSGGFVDPHADTYTPTMGLCWYPPQERFLLFVTAASEAWYTEDDGATWGTYGPTRYDTTPNFGVHVEAIADQFGNILLMSGDGGTLIQYASADAGASFTSVAATFATDDADVAMLANGSLMVAYVDNSSKDPEVRIIGSAFDDIDNATAISLGANTIDEIACCVDADGVAWVFALSNSTHIWLAYYSTDNGLTWTVAIDAYTPEASTAYPTKVRCVAAFGEAVWTYNATVGTTTGSDGSIWSTQFGGWSNLEHDVLKTSGQLFKNRWSFGGTTGEDGRWWPPIELPDNMGWTNTGAGTTTLGADGWNIQAGAVTTEFFSITRTYDMAAMAVMFEVEQVQGGLNSNSELAFEIRRRDGTNEYDVAVRIFSTGYRVYDTHGAATLQDVSVDMTTPLQILVVFFDALGVSDPDTIDVFHRRQGSSTWTHSGDDLTLTGTAEADTTDRIQFGVITSSVGTKEANWRFAGFCGRAEVRNSTTTIGNFSLCRWGKQMAGAGLPYPLRDEGDSTHRAFLTWRGARARFAETFAADAEHDYSADHLLPQVQPSPKVPWRSTGTASDESWAFDLTDAAYDSRLAHGWMWALCVTGESCPRQIILEEKPNGGSYTTIGTLDLAQGFTGLTYSLTGDQLRAGSGTTAADRHIWENEFAGGYVEFDPAGSGAGPLVRKILSNSAGAWSDDSTTTQAAFRLEGIDGSEDATEDCNIVHPGGVLLVPQSAAAGNHTRYLRVRVASGQNVPDSYYTIGSMVLGSVLVPGRQWGDGWSWRWTPNVQVEEDAYGTTHIRQVGPVRRELTVSWQDPQDWIPMRRDASPNYLAAGSTRAAEVQRDDVMMRLAGMLQQAKGGEMVVVALADVPDSNGATSITDPTLWLYGRLTGATVQGNQVVGNEGDNEAYRVESLTITELPWSID